MSMFLYILLGILGVVYLVITVVTYLSLVNNLSDYWGHVSNVKKDQDGIENSTRE